MAWSTPSDRISPDTKTDLYVDPVGFLARALHFWDPQVTWGVLQNQGYGYLFPMGPFFAAVGSIVPMAIAQRLWWFVLLTVGYLSMVWLLRELGIRAGWVPHIAALAFALSPRVITTLGGLSSEAHPVLLAPLILAPLVAASNGRMGARRAAGISGLAIVCCGGVNATATLMAIVPAGLWVITRSRWWRQQLTWWWTAAVALASAWWVGPLLMLGAYSPPFLDWIENSRMVAAPIDLLDVLRGTSHWLGHLVVRDGPWWPAGYALANESSLIVATALVTAVGLAGLALRSTPHRGYLLVVLLLGVLIIALPPSGPLASPLSTQAHQLLDGPLSPLRNVHKADPLIRLPVTVGLAFALLRMPDLVTNMLRTSRFDTLAGRVASAITAVLVIAIGWSASPGMTGQLTPRGTFEGMPRHWQQAAQWLTEHDDGSRSLLVPAANFGEYAWGRPLDEPIRPLSDSSYAVRDAVPLTPANTIRFLDAIEQRLQSGRAADAELAALARTGVRYLVLRNDLNTNATDAPPVGFAGSALRLTESATVVAEFGPRLGDGTGGRVPAIQIFEIGHPVATHLEVWPLSSVNAASGSSDALPAIVGAGTSSGPVIFDGDLPTAVSIDRRIDTDANRARERYFGLTRGQDVTSGLTLEQDRGAPDYRPWDAEATRSVVTVEGANDVTASRSLATDSSLLGLHPAYRPTAAFDGDDTTAWLTFGDPRPVLDLDLTTPISPARILLTPPDPELLGGWRLGVPTQVRVTTDSGSSIHDLDPDEGAQVVSGPGDSTTTLRLEVLDTSRGAPGQTLTGLAEVDAPGLDVKERVRTPLPGPGRTDAVVLGTTSTSTADGCVWVEERIRCVTGQWRPAEEPRTLRRSVLIAEEGEFTFSGTVQANPATPVLSHLVGDEIVSVTASSARSPGAAGAPTAAFDLDRRTAWEPASDDPAPRLTVTFAGPVTISEIQVRTRDRWTTRHNPVVRVTVDGREEVGALTGDGRLRIGAMTGRTVSVSFLRDTANRTAFASLEVEEVGLVGVPRSQPAPEIGAECGEGPNLLINDVAVPTRVHGHRDAALGLGSLAWEACVPVGLGFLESDTIDLDAWEGMSPASIIVTRHDGATPEASPDRPEGYAPIPSERPSPTSVNGHVTAGPERVLVTTDNTNPGWQATLGGRDLEPVTVDGFRQGFLVPEGASGELAITFAPDRTYRLALAIGGVLALLLLPMALVGQRSAPTLRSIHVPRQAVVSAVAAVAFATMVAGLWGAVTAAIGVALVGLGVRRWLPPAALVAGLVLSAGVMQVVAAEFGLRGPVPEAAGRLVLILGIVVAVVTPSGWSASRRTDN